MRVVHLYKAVWRKTGSGFYLIVVVFLLMLLSFFPHVLHLLF